MRIEIKIPPVEQVVQKGKIVKVAMKGKRWSQNQLGEYAWEKGVYIIHHNKKVKYVGTAFGRTTEMTFGKRLRREFQETADKQKFIFPKLAKLCPPNIKVTFFPLAKLREFVRAHGLKLNNYTRAILVERAMIRAYRPSFQKEDWILTR